MLAGMLATGPGHARADDVSSATPTVTADATEAPTATEAPATSAAPLTSEAPVTTEAPTTTEAPATTEAPVTTEVPATTTVEAADDAAAPEPGDIVLGELVQAYADPAPSDSGHEAEAEHDAAEHDEAGHDDTLLSWVQTESGDTVRVSTGDVTDVETGATVQVTLGAEVQDTAAVEGLEPAHELVAAEVLAASEEPVTAPTVAAVNHEVTVVLMQPGGFARDSTTLATLTNVVNGAVGDFWEQQSAGAARFGVVAGFDWATTTATCSDPFALWQAAADRAGWTAGARKHLLVYVPSGAPGCSYGLGTLGTSIDSGGLAYVQAPATSVVAHEFGHNMGLNHSSQLQCSATVEESASSTCQVSSYRDYYDVMGISWGQVGSLSALHASALGVLPAAQQVEVTPASGAGVHTLSPISGSSGTRAVKLTASSKVAYWLEFRPGSGQDSWLTTSANVVGVQPGVLVRRAHAGAGDSSLLLDATPSSASSWTKDTVAVLPVGAEVLLAGGQFRVKVTGIGATASVEVRPANTLPVASWDGLSASGSTLSVSGWAFDPDQPTVSGQVHVYVDGQGRSLTADGARPDVGKAYPGVGDAHGFSTSTTVAPGAHRVCVFAIDVDDPGQNTLLGCRSITTQQTLPVGSWDGLSASGATVSVS
ncbi:zinc-dependent metalloprotease family protein, partial [Modestobacter caceresii]